MLDNHRFQPGDIFYEDDNPPFSKDYSSELIVILDSRHAMLTFSVPGRYRSSVSTQNSLNFGYHVLFIGNTTHEFYIKLM